MTLTPEKLDEIERLAELATPGPWYYAGCNTVHDADHDEVAHPCDMGNDCATARYIAALDPATVRELVRAVKERDHQAARIAELEGRLDRVRALETHYSDERFDACDCPRCDGRREVRDKLTTILEGDEV